MSEQEGVTITLREVYDTVTKTHEAVQLMSPQMARVEQTATEALRIATDADNRSKDNEHRLRVVRNVFGPIATGTALAFIGNWLSKHMQ